MQGDRDGYNVSQLQLLGTRSSIAAEETLSVLRCAPAEATCLFDWCEVGSIVHCGLHDDGNTGPSKEIRRLPVRPSKHNPQILSAAGWRKRVL